jgi:hypothetical protein
MFIHGKDTFVSINGVNLSSYSNKSDFKRTRDSHDVTTFGNIGHVYNGGLTDGTATLEGIYDNTAALGPRGALEPLIDGATVTFIRRPEGTGTGKPQDSATVLITEYSESSEVADMVKWTCEMQISGSVTTTTQA